MNRMGSMRRASRQVTDLQEINAMLRSCDVCHIALNTAEGYPYVVPLNYGYELTQSGALTLYFHSAIQGRKLELLGENNAAGFAINGSHQLVVADAPCDYTYAYESIIGIGRLQQLDSESEKQHALSVFMRNFSHDGALEFPPDKLRATAVLRLDVEEYTAKRLSPNK